ncbi:proteasome subunit alpha [Candidatus Woesearchaeota archaeon]|nr:MAG: proteasome subunit alpha [Candidatus Woesearchaeota archaeon]
MQPMQHQMMGYDRAITMFSPDGRLLQVEYAKKTVRQGSTVIGMICKDGVLLVADKRLPDKLIVAEGVEKIFPIDDHLVATAAGIISDAQVLVDHAQVKAQQIKVTYGVDSDTLSIVKDVCSLKQVCTQSGGLRPFGVSLLIAGIDNNNSKKLYKTDPTGIYFQYKATVIGEGEPEIEPILFKEYKDDLSVEQGLSLSIKAMMKALNDKFESGRIDAAFVNAENRTMERVDKEKISKLIEEHKK